MNCNFRIHRRLLGPLELLHIQDFFQKCSEDLHYLCRTQSAPATPTLHLQVAPYHLTKCQLTKLKHLNQSLILESIFLVSSLPYLAPTNSHFLVQIFQVQVLSNGDKAVIVLPAAQLMGLFLLTLEVHHRVTAVQAQDTDLALLLLI